MTIVTLYTRPGCHLCENALRVLRRVSEDTPFTLREVDITADDALHTRYLERIPVVAVNDVEHFEFFVEEPHLRDILYREGR